MLLDFAIVRRLILYFALVLSVFDVRVIFGEITPKADFYVAADGDDTNSGTPEKPFATILQAQQTVRQRIANGLTTNIVVQIQGGVYRLNEPLQFDERDSGTQKYSISYVVPTNEIAIVSGGVQLTGWTELSSNLWTTTVPESLHSQTPFRYLFINGKRATRARKPNADAATPFFRILDSKLSDDLSTWEIKLPPDQLAAWKNASEMELVVFLEFKTFRKRVQSVEPLRGVVTLMPPHSKHSDYCGIYCTPKPGMACYLENARAFLDEPGEWYMDASTRQLWYWPRSGESLGQLEAYTPVLTNLVQIIGTKERPVQNLHFDGLSFCHTTWLMPDTEYLSKYDPTGIPSSSMLLKSAAIKMAACDNCSILNCQIKNIGGEGIQIDQPTRKFLILGTSIHDVGGDGIILWGAAPPAAPNINGEIVNNDVYDCGVEDHSSTAIHCGPFAEGLMVRNNLIHDCPYVGIALGSRANPNSCRNNTIVANYIHHVMLLQSDGGGIYEIGLQSNCTIRANFITEVLRSPGACGAPNNGIFMDEKSSGCTIIDNVINHTSGGALRFNEDVSKTIIGINFFGENVFYKGRVGQYSRSFANDRFMDIPHSSALDPRLLTVEAWIRPLSFAAGNDPSYWLVSKNGSELTDGHYSLLMSHNNIGAYLNIGGGRENCYAAWSHDSLLKSNEWSHVAMTYDGTNLSVFCNGALAGLSTVNRQRSTGSSLLRIGKRADSSVPSFAGLMDDVRIYSRALSAEEIRSQTIDYRLKTEDSSAAEGSAPAGLKSQVSSLSSTSQTPNSQPSTNSLQTQDSGPRTQDASTLSSQPPTASSQPTSDLRPLTSSKTSGLVLHFDFTAMHDQMEKIIAEAGPEEPYRTRFSDQRSAVSGQKAGDNSSQNLAPLQAGSAVSGQKTASSLKSGEDRSQKPEARDQRSEYGNR